MRYAQDTYGCVYFEHYLPDIENPAWRDEFRKWHERLAAEILAISDPKLRARLDAFRDAQTLTIENDESNAGLRGAR